MSITDKSLNSSVDSVVKFNNKWISYNDHNINSTPSSTNLVPWNESKEKTFKLSEPLPPIEYKLDSKQKTKASSKKLAVSIIHAGSLPDMVIEFKKEDIFPWLKNSTADVQLNTSCNSSTNEISSTIKYKKSIMNTDRTKKDHMYKMFLEDWNKPAFKLLKPGLPVNDKSSNFLTESITSNSTNSDTFISDPPASPISFTGKARRLSGRPHRKLLLKVHNDTDELKLKLEPGWAIASKDGYIFKESPAYLSFRKHFIDDGRILMFNWLITKIEKFLLDYAIPYANIDCQSLMSLCNTPLIYPVNNDSILKCLSNHEEISKTLGAQRYKHESLGKERAAVIIQAVYKMYKRSQQYAFLLKKLEAAKVLQKRWRIRASARILREKILQQIRDEDTKCVIRLQGYLERDAKSESPQIFKDGNRRIIVQITNWRSIHECSTTPDYDFGRCFPLLKSDVEMIFVLPYLDSSKIAHFQKLFMTRFLEDNPVTNGRVKFLVPEISSHFKASSSVASAIIASSHSIKTLRSMTEGVNSVIFTDTINEADIRLCSVLKLPIYGSSPSGFEAVCTRGKARKFLLESGIPLINAVVSLAANTLQLMENFYRAASKDDNAILWSFIQSTPNNSDLGYYAQNPIAYINSDALSEFKTDPDFETSIKSIKAKVKDKKALRKKSTKGDDDTPYICESTIKAQEIFQSAFRFIHPSINTMEMFMNAWQESHGFIQAIPCSDPRRVKKIEYGILIEWGGECKIQISTETVFDKDFKSSGMYIPQSEMDHLNAMRLVTKISENASRIGIFGYCTVEFMAWKTEMGIRKFGATNFKPNFSVNILKAQTALLSTGCVYSDSDNLLLFKRQNVKIRTNHLQKSKFVNNELAQNTFFEKFAQMPAVEARVIFYQDTLEHIEFESMGRKTAASFLTHQGLTFDPWIKCGTIIPSEEGKKSNNLPIITIQKDRFLATQSFLKSLYLIDQLLTDVSKEMVINFETIAKRVIYEMLELRKVIDVNLVESKPKEMPFYNRANYMKELKKLDNLSPMLVSELIPKYVDSSLLEKREFKHYSDDINIRSKPRMDPLTISLLKEAVSSVIAAEHDPTFKTPILQTAQKRTKNKISAMLKEEDILSPIAVVYTKKYEQPEFFNALEASLIQRDDSSVLTSIVSDLFDDAKDKLKQDVKRKESNTPVAQAKGIFSRQSSRKQLTPKSMNASMQDGNSTRGSSPRSFTSTKPEES